MGQIQNAISGAVSTIVGAQVASELRASKLQNEKNSAKQEKPGLIEEADKLDLEAADLDLQIADYRSRLAGFDNSKPDQRLKGAVITADMQKAERSLQIVREKQAANKMQRERVSKILGEPVESEYEMIDRLIKQGGVNNG